GKSVALMESWMPSNIETKTPSEHAQVFIEQYEELLRWARYLCQGDVAAAEDLVQTAYIQFVTYQPPLDAIENLLAYLRRLIANVHRNELIRSSAQKRGGAVKNIDLPLIEELVGYEETNDSQARELLLEIAYYASERRQQSKTGSVLILRFLLGYFPKEISQVLMVSIFAVNNLIMRSRNELKEFLKNPAKKINHKDTKITKIR